MRGVAARWPSRLRQRAERVLRPGSRAVILLYHRIAVESADPYHLCVTPPRFEEHLQALRRIARPVRLADLAAAIRTRSLRDDVVCVTFDDAYADNLEVARPLLERHDIPATVFATTGRAGRDREFWWDELERVFLEPRERPASLELEIGAARHTWELGADAVYTPGDVERYAAWYLHDEDSPTARHAAFREAYALVRPLRAAERIRVLDRLRDWAGLDGAPVRAARRALQPDEIVELARGGLVDVGAHTVEHPALPSRAMAEQRDEVAGSKAQLEQWLGRPVTGFAYPYGQYDATSVRAVREAGYLHACACGSHAAWRGSDPYLLPRIEVTEMNGDALAELVCSHLSASLRG